VSLIEICGVNIKVQGRLIRIARLDAEKYHFLDDPLPVLDGLKKSGIRVDLFTFMQKLPETSPRYHYPMELDNLAVLPISTFEQWWTQQIGFKARNKAKQAAKKGVIIREVPFNDALVQGIWAIYNECPIRQGRLFPHYGKDIETVRKEEATYLESSIFIGAFLEDKLIGFSKLVLNEARTQAGLMNIVSMIGHRDLSPTNALIAQAVRSCAERGILYLVYSNFAYGKKLRDSLSDFKKRNGFQQINLPRYYVPLTRIGALALRLDLHHRFVDFLPESLTARIRGIRNAWYKRMFQVSTESS
jgi:hypothetical protein